LIIMLTVLQSCNDSPKVAKNQIPIDENGNLNGVEINYFPDGRLKSKITWKNNLKDGPFEVYHEEGYLHSTGEYVKDLKEGLYKIYYPNGKIKVVFLAEHDFKNGLSTTYYESGKIKRLAYFKNDSSLCALEYDSLGRFIDGQVAYDSCTIQDTIKFNESMRISVVLHDSTFVKYFAESKCKFYKTKQDVANGKIYFSVPITTTKNTTMIFDIPAFEEMGKVYYEVEIIANNSKGSPQGNTGKIGSFIVTR
jgi:hypothetical protein